LLVISRFESGFSTRLGKVHRMLLRAGNHIRFTVDTFLAP